MEAQVITQMSSDEAVVLSKVLAGKLHGRIQEGETLRRQPDETVQDIIDSGLATILKPIRFGGHELSLDVLADTTIEVAKENPAAGWCYTFIVVHQWMLAAWPEQAQREIWSENPTVNIATAFAPPRNQNITHVEGGYRVSGQWSFSSGIDHSEWVMATSTEISLNEGEQRERHMFLIPRSDYEIINEWHVAGLKASGSNGFVVSNVFVPAHRVISLTKWAGVGETPGMSVNQGASYHVPLYCALPICLTSAILGATIGAYETYRKGLRDRLSKASSKEAARLTHFMQRVTELSAKIDAAEGLLRKALDVIRPGGEFNEEQRAKLHRNYSYLARSCSQVMDDMFQFSGSASIYESNLMQNYWRDVKAMSMHGYLNFDAAIEAFGTYELGLNE